MNIEEVKGIIEKEWKSISSCETFKEVIEEKYNGSYAEALEEIKYFVEYDEDYFHTTDLEEYTAKCIDGGTDEEYIKEFLKDMCIGCLYWDDIKGFQKYSYVLSKMAI